MSQPVRENCRHLTTDKVQSRRSRSPDPSRQYFWLTATHQHILTTELLTDTMSTNPGTMRGPSRTGQRGGIPFTPNTPTTSSASSAIPRPVETTHAAPSESGASLSAGRQKQAKRDEVCILASFSSCSEPVIGSSWRLYFASPDQ